MNKRKVLSLLTIVLQVVYSQTTVHFCEEDISISTSLAVIPAISTSHDLLRVRWMLSQIDLPVLLWHRCITSRRFVLSSNALVPPIAPLEEDIRAE